VRVGSLIEECYLKYKVWVNGFKGVEVKWLGKSGSVQEVSFVWPYIEEESNRIFSSK